MARIVLESYKLPKAAGAMDAEIVLVHLTDNSVTPYVTWQRNTVNGDSYWGHYFTAFKAARRDFEKRIGVA